MNHPALNFYPLVSDEKKNGFNHNLREKTVASLLLIKISAI